MDVAKWFLVDVDAIAKGSVVSRIDEVSWGMAQSCSLKISRGSVYGEWPCKRKGLMNITTFCNRMT